MKEFKTISVKVSPDVYAALHMLSYKMSLEQGKHITVSDIIRAAMDISVMPFRKLRDKK